MRPGQAVESGAASEGVMAAFVVWMRAVEGPDSQTGSLSGWVYKKVGVILGV